MVGRLGKIHFLYTGKYKSKANKGFPNGRNRVDWAKPVKDNADIHPAKESGECHLRIDNDQRSP